ncbi:MAG: IPT/TIG domain-containing protein [Allomuricauda sp.]
MKKIMLLPIAIGLLVLSCSKDENPSNPENGPDITSFSPIEGPVGQNIWIMGKNFGDTPADNVVKIGNTVATVTSAKATEIFITVPEGATTGAISVTVDGKTDTAGTFTVIESTEHSGISLNKSTVELFTLDSETLTTTVTGGANAEDIVWSSDDESIAIVDDNGKITGVAEGSTKVTAFISEEVSTNCIVNVKRSIYVAGYDYSNEKEIAAIWKNGIPTYLTDEQNKGRARSVFVTETDVYVCGYETLDNDIDMAKVWKNGELLYSLSDGNNSAIAHSIHVFEDDVYVSGVENDNAMLWKNGSAVPLNDGTSGVAYGLFVNSSVVYTSGKVENGPATWKNSEKTELAYVADFFSIALDIAATNIDEYAVGFDNLENKTTATIWKNGGQPQYLDTNDWSMARSIFIDEGDIYVVGGNAIENIEFPVLWKNDEPPMAVEDGGVSGYAASVYVYKGDVYIAGVTYGDLSEARIWENGTPVSTFQDMQEAFFYSVFVR